MTKQFSLVAVALMPFFNTVNAQVPRKIMVEHFTNSKCSICASRNPGFYSNLAGESEAIHLSVYPSAPYPACAIYQQNTTENDARTNYYGVYGSTPRLVVNGVVVAPGADYSDKAIFTPYEAQTSPADIRIQQTKFGSDSIQVRVCIKTVATHSLGGLSLFVALAEDTVFYTGSNGEPRHFDVFRKALSSVSGQSLQLPANLGDSLVFFARAQAKPFWDFGRIYALAVLQESGNKHLVQAARFGDKSTLTGMMLSDQEKHIQLYPNPGAGVFRLYDGAGGRLEVRNSLGTLVYTGTSAPGASSVDLRELSSGIYFISLVRTNGSTASGRLVLSRD